MMRLGMSGTAERSRTADRAVDVAFREEWGRVVATLIRRTRDWDLAEECAQEAFASALESWAADGVPRKPGAWLTTVASNRALDRLRRAKRGAELLERIGHDPTMGARSEAEMDWSQEPDEQDGIADDRLRLIFTCCHPALSLEARVALTLRSLAGLTTAEIARAFLVPEATMAKRLTRAKAKIGAAGIPYRVPPAQLLAERLSGVLAVVYLLFNEGYAASSGERLVRVDLCSEAIRLGRLLHALMADEPEVSGLLALMLFNDSRREARVDADGELVPLEQQDRARWDREEIDQARQILASELSRRELGAYQLQAAIAQSHATAPDSPSTDWREIAHTYELLTALAPSPVVELNRAVAVAMSGDFDRGLAVVERLAASGELAGYHLLEATRADLLRRRGDVEAATRAYVRALELAPSERECRYLRRRLSELADAG